MGADDYPIATELPARARKLNEEAMIPATKTHTHAEWNTMHEDKLIGHRPNRRRLRRGGGSFLMTAGSFTLSSGSNTCGND